MQCQPCLTYALYHFRKSTDFSIPKPIYDLLTKVASLSVLSNKNYVTSTFRSGVIVSVTRDVLQFGVYRFSTLYTLTFSARLIMTFIYCYQMSPTEMINNTG